MNRIFLQSILLVCLVSACNNSKKQARDFKPMKPSGTHYTAYCPNGTWALEMDLNGEFVFQEYLSGFEIDCKSTEYIGKKEGYKQRLEWNMFNGKELEQQVRFTVLQENCHNFGYVNNPFILEVFYDGNLLYRQGGCGTFHNKLEIEGVYNVLTVNGQDVKEFYKLNQNPSFELKKTKSSNMLYGRTACRYWNGVFNILESTISINYNIHPTADCVESYELTQFTEAFGNKQYFYKLTSDAKKGTLLTLLEKYDTFVLQKIK